MMLSFLPLLLLALTPAFAAPPLAVYDEYRNMIVPAKRAALVLDRLLIALQKALHEEALRAEGPRTAPLRISALEDGDLISGTRPRAEAASALELRDLDGPRPAPLQLLGFDDNTSSLQRRGQNAGRGRVLRCYFNAVTCF